MRILDYKNKLQIRVDKQKLMKNKSDNTLTYLFCPDGLGCLVCTDLYLILKFCK